MNMPKILFRAVVKRIMQFKTAQGEEMTRLIVRATHADPTNTLSPGEFSDAQKLANKMFASIPLKGADALAQYQILDADLPEIGAGSVCYFTIVGLFTPDWNLRHNGRVVLQPAGFNEDAFSFSCEPKEEAPSTAYKKLVPLTFAAPAVVAETEEPVTFGHESLTAAAVEAVTEGDGELALAEEETFEEANV